MRDLAVPMASRAFACLKHFLRQPTKTADPYLLMEDLPSWIVKASVYIQPNGTAVISFTARSKDGLPYQQPVLMTAHGFARLRMHTVLGATAFIDHTDETPYFKIFGNKPSSAGIMFARLIAGAGEGEIVRYANGNTLDLRSENLIVQAGSSKRDAADVFGETLLYAHALKGTNGSNGLDLPAHLTLDYEKLKYWLRFAEEADDNEHGREIQWLN